MNEDEIEVGDTVMIRDGDAAPRNFRGPHTIQCAHPETNRYYLGIQGNRDSRYYGGTICNEHNTEWVVRRSNVELIDKNGAPVKVRKLNSNNIIRI